MLKSIGPDNANVLYVVQGVIPRICIRQAACVIRLEVCLIVLLHYEGMKGWTRMRRLGMKYVCESPACGGCGVLRKGRTSSRIAEKVL
jgi:hypothetical protein